MVEQRISNGGNSNSNNNNGADKQRPSSERRRRLREVDANGGTVPTVSNFFPLERYYDASDKVFQSFETAFEKKRLDEAYVYGMRYSTFFMDGIRNHDYYSARKFEGRQIQAKKRIGEVVTKLELVSEWMDAEEKAKGEQRQAIIKRQQEERMRKQRELEQKQIEELQKRIAQQKQSTSTLTAEQLEESALAKLQRLSQPQGVPLPPQQQDQQTDPNKKVTWNLPRAEPDGELLSAVSFDTSNELPPPLLPPSDDENDTTQNGPLGSANAPPSYNSILKQSSYFGPGLLATATEDPSAPPYDEAAKLAQMKKPRKPMQLPIRQFIAQTVAKHREYQHKGKIQVSPLQTYQGRVSGSTNGCTVISACVVSKHMETYGGVTDAQVQSVIDRDCVPLLKAIRNKLDLGAASLIIPSDVHDYLVDKKLLYQHKFVGAAGGNIIDPAHAGELLNLLKGEQGKTSHLKAAATLFFREHVVSIVKFPTGPDDAVYDMVDSLPTCNGRGSRTRCHSLDALKVHLAWYCTRKFSDSNITYIERNKWDDSMADFDPRVFQAFVWANLPEPKSN